MALVKNLGLILGFALVSLLIYNFLRIYVLSKININKWIVLFVAVIVFFIPIFLGSTLQGIPSLLQSGLFIILFLWFMDLSGFNNKRRKKDHKDIVIKPKAKPNRVNKNK